MRNMTIYVTLALLCTIAFTGQSADTPDKQNSIDPKIVKSNEKFEVEVSVRCDDENTTAFIESHIKRELRSLQDVEIVPLGNLGRYELTIVAIEHTVSGRKTGGISIATMFERKFINAGPIMSQLNHELTRRYQKHTEDYKKAMLMLDREIWDLRDKTLVRVAGGMTDRLDKICKDIVVSFDTKMLESDRNGK